MRTRILILFIGIFAFTAAPVGAQFRCSLMHGEPVYCTSAAQVREVGMTSTSGPVIVAQRTNGAKGVSRVTTPVVYQAFSLSVPSEITAKEFGIKDPTAAPVARKGFITGPEWGEGPCPVGEPWILLILALAFGVGIYFKTRKIKQL